MGWAVAKSENGMNWSHLAHVIGSLYEGVEYRQVRLKVKTTTDISEDDEVVGDAVDVLPGSGISGVVVLDFNGPDYPPDEGD